MRAGSEWFNSLRYSHAVGAQPTLIMIWSSTARIVPQPPHVTAAVKPHKGLPNRAAMMVIASPPTFTIQNNRQSTVRMTLQEVKSAQIMAQITNKMSPAAANTTPTIQTHTMDKHTPMTVTIPPRRIKMTASTSKKSQPNLLLEELEADGDPEEPELELELGEEPDGELPLLLELDLEELEDELVELLELLELLELTGQSSGVGPQTSEQFLSLAQVTVTVRKSPQGNRYAGLSDELLELELPV